MLSAIRPDQVTPGGALPGQRGGAIEVTLSAGGGAFSAARIVDTAPVWFSDATLSPEALAEHFSTIADWSTARAYDDSGRAGPGPRASGDGRHEGLSPGPAMPDPPGPHPRFFLTTAPYEGWGEGCAVPRIVLFMPMESGFASVPRERTFHNDQETQMARIHPSKAAEDSASCTRCCGAAALRGRVGNAGAVEIDTRQRRHAGALRQHDPLQPRPPHRRQDPAILGNLNADDGDRNFARAASSPTARPAERIRRRLQEEVRRARQRRGLVRPRLRGLARQHERRTSNHLVDGAPALGLPDYTKRYYKGPSGECLDAFVFGSVDSARAGQRARGPAHGELGRGAAERRRDPRRVLRPGAARPGKAFASPGIEAKELYRPLTQISGSVQATPQLAFAAQYFLDWEASRLPESGSYLGLNDALQTAANPSTWRRRARTARPRPHAQEARRLGPGARWSPEWLEGTMGVYLRNFSDKLPQASS
jgi:hypothetical protein